MLISLIPNNAPLNTTDEEPKEETSHTAELSGRTLVFHPAI